MSSSVSNNRSNKKSSKSPSDRSRPRNINVDRAYTDRTPGLALNKEDDAVTSIGTKLAELLLEHPAMNLDKYLKSAAHSRSEVCKADVTILVCASIMTFMGNLKSRDSLLQCSRTCSKLYYEMSLDKESMSRMFTTMIFTLNPNLVSLTDKMIKVVIDRNANKEILASPDEQLQKCISSLVRNGNLKIKDFEGASSSVISSFHREASTSGSIQTTPTELIHPDDSITSVGTIPRYREKIKERDLHDYISRSKKRQSANFYEEFPTVERPVTLRRKLSNSGIGFKKSPIQILPTADEFNALLENVNSMSMKDKPVAYNFLGNIQAESKANDAVSTSDSILLAPPSVASVQWTDMDKRKFRSPSFSDAVETVIEKGKGKEKQEILRPRDSLEDMYFAR